MAILRDETPVGQQVLATSQSSEQAQSQETPLVSTQSAPIISGNISPGVQKTHDIPIAATTNATFILAWPDGNMDFTLTTPGGTLIDPSASLTNPDNEYFSAENTTIKGYTVQYPESGVWKVNISAVDIPEEEEYTVLTFLDTTVTLSLNVAKYQYDPGEAINISANLTNGVIPLSGAFVIATVDRPDQLSENVTLYDDGLHNDKQSDDGLYGNSYNNTDSYGAYSIKVSASGMLDGNQFARQVLITVWVEQYPDLTLSPSDIIFSNNTPLSGDNVTIAATIHNIGDTATTNATIAFYDGVPATGTLIGERTVNVPAGGTANTTVSWTALSGSHEIHVRISPYNSFLEKSYDNNNASNVLIILSYGDANGDGVVNVLDVTKVERIIGHLDQSTPGADANQDGKVNAVDITKVERIIAGLQ